MKQLTNNPEAKLASRERKIFDVNGKVKERFKLLISLEEDGVQQSEVNLLYARRAHDIVSLCTAHMGYFQVAHSTKGKQVNVEHILPVLETMRRIILEMPDQVRAGWNAEWFTRELENSLHSENHPTIRRAGVDILLAYIDTLGQEVQHSHISLLLSALNWNAVRQISEPQPGLFLPKGVRVLRSGSYDFFPKRAPSQNADVEAQQEVVEMLQDFFDFLTKQTKQLGFWWSLFKGAFAPILYPQFADASGSGGAAATTEGVTGGFRGIGWRVHILVANALLSLLQQEQSAKVLLSTLQDMRLLLGILGYSSTVLPHGEMTALYRTARMYFSWLAEPAPGTLFAQHPQEAVPLMADALANMFQANREDVTSNQTTPLSLQVRTALFEIASDFFVLVQTKTPRNVGVLKLYLNRIATPVLRGLGTGSAVYEATHEMVSRAFYSQWVRARPSYEQCQSLASSVCALIASMKPTRSTGTAVCVPYTRCLGESTFSSNPLVLHWRRVVLGLLRVVLSMQAGVELPQPHASLCVTPAGSPAGSPSGSALPTPTSASNKQGCAPSRSDVKSLSVLAIHRQRTPALSDTSVETLISDIYADVEEITATWLATLVAVLREASTEALPDAAQLTIIQTLADVISDLLTAGNAHRIITPAQQAQSQHTRKATQAARQAAPPPAPPPHLLLASPTRLYIAGGLLPDTLARIALPVLLSAPEKTSAEFRNCGGPQIAVSALCDLLSQGGHAGLAYLPLIRRTLCAALSGSDALLTRSTVHRLCPAGRASPTPSLTFLTGMSPSGTSKVDREGLRLLPVLALAAYGCLHTPCPAGLPQDKKEREVAVRCSAVCLLNTAAAACSVRGADPIDWPQGWSPHGSVAAAVNGVAPRTYAELLGVVLSALRVGLSAQQPHEARRLAMKGLGCVSLSLLRRKGSDAASLPLQTGLINTATTRLLDANCGVALEASACLTTLLDSATHEEESTSAGIGETIASLFASSLMTALGSVSQYPHPSAISSLVHGLHCAASRPGKLGRGVTALCLDALIYAASGTMHSRYSVLSLHASRREVSRALPLEKSGDANTPGGARIVVPPVAPPQRGGGVAPTWWGDDEDSAAEVRHSAESALYHLAVHHRGLAGEEEEEEAGGGTLCQGSSPSEGGLPGASLTLMCGDRAHVSLSQGGGGGGGGSSLRMTCRTVAGRYTWDVRPVQSCGESLFETRRPLEPGEASPTDAHSITGRGRTHAMHEAQTAPGAVAVQNLSLQIASDLHTPEPLALGGNAITGGDESWQQARASELQAVDTLLSDHAERAAGAPEVAVAVGGGGVGGGGGGGGGGVASIRCALVGLPLLDLSCGPVQTGSGLQSCLAEKGPGWEAAVEKLDSVPDRDTLAISVLFAGERRTRSLQEVMQAGAAGFSPGFRQFISLLGDEVALASHVGYTGLDAPTQEGRIIYHATARQETAFLIPGLLPEEVRECAARSCKVQVVWSEGAALFCPNTLGLEDATHFIVLSPLGPELLRVSLGGRVAFPPGPLHDGLLVPAVEGAAMVRSHAQRCTDTHPLGYILQRQRALAETASHYACLATLSEVASLRL